MNRSRDWASWEDWQNKVSNLALGENVFWTLSSPFLFIKKKYHGQGVNIYLVYQMPLREKSRWSLWLMWETRALVTSWLTNLQRKKKKKQELRIVGHRIIDSIIFHISTLTATNKMNATFGLYQRMRVEKHKKKRLSLIFLLNAYFVVIILSSKKNNRKNTIEKILTLKGQTKLD